MKPFLAAALLLVAGLAAVPPADAWMPDSHHKITARATDYPLVVNLHWEDMAPTPGPAKFDDGTCYRKELPFDYASSMKSPAAILAPASEHPDRMDIPLGGEWKEWGRCIGRLTPADSWQWRHAYFVAPDGTYLLWGSAPDMTRHYYEKARDAFRVSGQFGRFGNSSVEGWTYLGFATHYVEDMGVPYHDGYMAPFQIAPHVTDAILRRDCVGSAEEDSGLGAGHDRWECDNVAFLKGPEAVDVGSLAIPSYGNPGDYASELAKQAVNYGPAITSGYVMLDVGKVSSSLGGGPETFQEAREGLNGTAQALDALTEAHVIGLWQHLFNEFPELTPTVPVFFPAGPFIGPNPPSPVTPAQPATISGTVSNTNSWTTTFVVRLVANACTGFDCADATSIVAEQTVTLAPLETRTVTFTLTPEQAASALAIVYDAVPNAGRGCIQLAGCVLERSEASGNVSEAPSVLAPAMPDLSVRPEGITVFKDVSKVLVDVQNVGHGDAGAFSVRLFSRAPDGSLALLATQQVAGLAADRGTTVPITYSGALYSAVVRVDEAGDVAEVDDVGNNQASVDGWVISGASTLTGTQLAPGDVTLLPGGRLTLDHARLQLRDGASLHVAPGATLAAANSTIEAAPGSSSYYLRAAGGIALADSRVEDVLGGIRTSSASTIERSTLAASAASPALVALDGVLGIKDTRIGGNGTGLVVGAGALVLSENTTYTGPSGAALEVNGGRFSGSRDTFQSALSGVRIAAGGLVLESDGAIRPQAGWSSGATLLGIDLTRPGSGTFQGEHVTLGSASKAIAGSSGRVGLVDSSVDAAKNVEAAGTMEIRVTNTTFGPGARTFAGSAWMETQWPVDLKVVSPAPDLAPLEGAAIDIYDASGARVWNGTSGPGGAAFATVVLRTESASGTTANTPHRFEAQYNGPRVGRTLTLPQSAAVQLEPPVVRDLAVVDANVTSGASDQANVLVANLEGATTAGVSVRIAVDGVPVSTPSLGTLAPYETRTVTVPLPAAAGIHTVTATVDPSNAVAEADEANNAASTQYWTVAASETCTTAKSLSGTLTIKAGKQLTLGNGCALSFGAAGSTANRIVVAPTATLLLGASSVLSASSAVDIEASGAVRIANATVSGLGGIFADHATVDIADSRIAAEGNAVLAENGSTVSVRRSTFTGMDLANGVAVRDGALTVTDSAFTGFTGVALDAENVAAPTVLRTTVWSSTTGIMLVNASAAVTDSVFAGNVSQPYVAIASQPRFLNVSMDPTKGWIAPGDRVELAWHARARMTGSDGQPVSGATVTVIDRVGEWKGQWDTGSDGLTPVIDLAERFLSDSDGDGKPTLESESDPREPYILESQAGQVPMPLKGNALVDLRQAYATVLDSPAPYVTLAPGGTGTMTVRVQNTGSGDDTIALAGTASRPGWGITFTPGTVTLARQQTTDVTARVTAPNVSDQVATFNVTATSEDGQAKGGIQLWAKTGANALPHAQFGLAPGAAYVGEAVTFTDTSTDADGWVAGRTWAFGDGASSAAATAVHAFAAPGDYNVTLTATDNAGGRATASQAFHVLNRAPILASASVSPSSLLLGDTATYGVVYRDLEGDDPASVKLYVDGQPGVAMTRGAGSSLSGITYTLQKPNLAAGSHRFRVEATDARGAATLYPVSYDLPGPSVDTRPVLSAVSVTPATGTGGTLFEFKATYADADDDAPDSIRVTVAGKTLSMARLPSSQGYAAGVPYSASTTLDAAGTYPYSVDASDGRAAATPVTGSLTVSSAIGLSAPAFTPATAGTSATFTFTVTYKDSSGAAPSSVTLFLDGQPKAMAVVTPANYATGATFRYAGTGLAAGAHTFHVEAVKGGVATRLPASGELQGPVVNTPPTARLGMAAEGTVATLFQADSTASTDAESATSALETRMAWGDGNRSAWAKGRLHDHEYAKPGIYDTLLEVRDPFGAIGSTAQRVTVAASAPTAAFTVTPTTGDVATQPGTGTVFLFRPSSSGDLEDPIDALQGRWDWEGDGAWDTPWGPVTSHSTHVYGEVKTYAPRLEVRDTSGLSGTASRFVRVNGLRDLAFDVPAADLISQRGERHDFAVEVPANLANLDVRLDFPGLAGNDLDLFVQRGALADPAACGGSTCHASARVASEGPEEVCIRLPTAGTYYVTVYAKDHADGAAASYQLLARKNSVDATLSTVNCALFGST